MGSGRLLAQRNVNIIMELLLTDKTLEAIAKRFGITKQRVLQVFKHNTGMTRREAYKELGGEDSEK